MLNLLGTSIEFDRANGLASMAGPTRYFLYRYMSDEEFYTRPSTVAEYVERYKLNDRVVCRALKELVDGGVLVKEWVKGERLRGRYRYLLKSEFVDNLADEGVGILCDSLRNLAEHVLTASGKHVGKSGQRWLTPYNRLVLATLLVRSDPAGAVYGVGASDLKRIAGLSDDGLRSQLSRLMELGFIRSRVSGLTGAHLFGVSKGAYFLNLSHRDFQGLGGSSLVLIRYDSPPKQTFHHSAAGIYGKAASILEAERRSSGPNISPSLALSIQKDCAKAAKDFEAQFKIRGECGERFNIHRYFADVPIDRFSRYLQMLINRYASQIVNYCLCGGGWQGNAQEKNLVATIEQDLWPSSDELPLFSAVVDAIKWASIQEAFRVWEMLVSSETIWHMAMSGLRCAIMPLFDPRLSSGIVTVVLSGRGLQVHEQQGLWEVDMLLPRGRVKQERERAQSLIIRKGMETDLTNQKAIALGLRSIGKKYPPKKGN